MPWPRAILALAASAICITGCGRQPSTDAPAAAPSSAPAATAGATSSSGTITVVGDDTTPQVAAELRNRGLSVSEDPATLGSAAMIVIAEDAPNGIRESHRKLAPQIAQNKNATILWLLTNMSKMNDAELVGVLQTEAQDLLKERGSANPKLQFATDTDQTTASPSTLKGWPAVTQFLTTHH
jgi:hypothetical protein